MATNQKRSERALQIAKLQGWEFASDSPYPEQEMRKTIKNEHKQRVSSSFIIRKYSSYNTLMPMVEKLNTKFNNPNTGNRGIQIGLNYVLYIHDPDDNNGTEIAFAYRANLSGKQLIDALQQAIILALTPKETT